MVLVAAAGSGGGGGGGMCFGSIWAEKDEDVAVVVVVWGRWRSEVFVQQQSCMRAHQATRKHENDFFSSSSSTYKCLPKKRFSLLLKSLFFGRMTCRNKGRREKLHIQLF